MAERPRLLLLGAAGALAAGVLQGAAAAGFGVAEAWTMLAEDAPIRRRDRRLRYIAPRWSVACRLDGLGAPIRRIGRLSRWDDAVAAARATGADILVSAGFMQRVPETLLDAFPGRVFNIHPALLPRRRGPHPTQASLLEGTIDTDGGVTLHRMNARFDEGDIVAQRPVAFDRHRPHAYGFALGRAAASLVARDLPRHLAGHLPAVAQDPALATAARVGRVALGPGTTLAAAQAVQSGLGLLWPTSLAETGGRVVVEGMPHPLGPPTGARPFVGRWSVELDLADARVRMRRRGVIGRFRSAVCPAVAAFVAASFHSVV